MMKSDYLGIHNYENGEQLNLKLQNDDEIKVLDKLLATLFNNERSPDGKIMFCGLGLHRWGGIYPEGGGDKPELGETSWPRINEDK